MKLPVSLSVGFGSALGGLSRFYADHFYCRLLRPMSIHHFF